MHMHMYDLQALRSANNLEAGHGRGVHGLAQRRRVRSNLSIWHRRFTLERHLRRREGRVGLEHVGLNGGNALADRDAVINERRERGLEVVHRRLHAHVHLSTCTQREPLARARTHTHT